MRNIRLLLCCVLGVIKTNAQPCDLDYSKYYLTFKDDFDTYSTSGSPSFAFRYHPAFMARWRTHTDDGWGAQNEYYYDNKATMPTLGIVRLSNSKIPVADRFYVGTPPRYVSDSSGMLVLHDSYDQMARYGIIEARIRFPKDVLGVTPSPSVSTWDRPQPAFWITPSGGTEIDIIDNGANKLLTYRIFDWYTGASETPQYHVGVEVDDDDEPFWEHDADPFHTCDGEIDDFSYDFHVYSCKWDPAIVYFFIDGKLAKSIPHTTFRTHEGVGQLLISLLSYTASQANMYMDVDWVKIWYPKCQADLTISNSYNPGMTPIVPLPHPGMYKNEHITLNTSAFLLKTHDDFATVFEAKSTTISPNFVSDQSVYLTEPYSWDGHSATLSTNGFFLIRPTDCTEPVFRPVIETGNANGLPEMIQNSKLENAVTGSADIAKISDVELASSNFVVTPIPANDNIYLSYTGAESGVLKYNITDAAGKVLISGNTFSYQNVYPEKVDISSLVPGMYFVVLTHNGAHEVRKIVKL